MSAGFISRPAEGLNYASAAAMFRARVQRTPELTALRFKQGSTWRSWRWRDWYEATCALAAGLQRLGVRRGTRVCIMADNSRAWFDCDLAIACLGAVSVPIYPTVSAEDASYILADSGCAIALVDRRILRDAIEDRLWADCKESGLRHWVVIDSRGVQDLEAGRLPVHGLDSVAEGAGDDSEAESASIDLEIAKTGPDDEFSVVYTSGTTGTPKGVVLSQRNIVYEAWAIKNSIAVDRTDEHLLVLPLAHIFARHMVWAAVESGAITAFGSGPTEFETEMREIAPTYVGGVPRMYEKIRQRIETEADGSVAQRKLFDWAMEVGRRASLREQRGLSVSRLLRARRELAQRAVFSRIGNAMGGRLRFFISGAAPLPRELGEFFHATGILVLEGYGLTETTGATHVNRPDRHRFGTVGPALPGCEVLIAGDGEILLRGSNVMTGYLGLADETAAAIDELGWLHTGDIGEITDGFLRITGRKKDVIITAGGKNIAPQKLESRLRAQEGLAHALVVGDERPYLIALLTLDEQAMEARASREGLGCRGYGDLARHPRVKEWVGEQVADVNRGLAPYETIKRFAVLEEPLSIHGGDLTPTDKVRRGTVTVKYRHVVDDLYDDA